MGILGIIGLGVGSEFRGRIAAASARTPAKPYVQLLAVSVPFKVMPAIYGDVVAWGGTSVLPHPSHIYLSRRHPFRPRSVAASAQGDLFNDTQLSAHWLTWMEYSPTRLTWSIQARNRRTGRTYTVDSSQRGGAPSTPLELPLPSLSGDSIAWPRIVCARRQCGDAWASVIDLMRLPHGRRETVRTTRFPCLQTLPWLSDRILVWDQEGTCQGQVGSDVEMLRRGTGRVTGVTSNHASSFPTTNGWDIAWKQARPSERSSSRMVNGAIMILNLPNRRPSMVSTPRSCHDPQTGWSSCSTTPKMSRGALAWLGENGSTVEALDLKTDHHFILSRYHQSKRLISAPALVGWGWNRSVIWEQDKQNPNTAQGTQYIAIADLP
jgi:hypothetical protein